MRFQVDVVFLVFRGVSFCGGSLQVVDFVLQWLVFCFWLLFFSMKVVGRWLLLFLGYYLIFLILFLLVCGCQLVIVIRVFGIRKSDFQFVNVIRVVVQGCFVQFEFWFSVSYFCFGICVWCYLVSFQIRVCLYFVCVCICTCFYMRMCV